MCAVVLTAVRACNGLALLQATALSKEWPLVQRSTRGAASRRNQGELTRMH
jgi:hypothetical protein